MLIIIVIEDTVGILIEKVETLHCFIDSNLWTNQDWILATLTMFTQQPMAISQVGKARKGADVMLVASS